MSQLATPDPTKLQATWTMSANTGIASYTLEVYDSSDNLVKTINNYTSGSAITGLTPCTEYYVKLYTVSSGSPYCDGGLISTSSKTASANNTTNGYTYTINKSNVSLKSGETEASTSCEVFMAEYEPESGYLLPTSITVTGASSYDWEDGVLMIDKGDVTGNVTVTITGQVASNFTNNATVFIQAYSSSAWDANACVKAWFHSYGGSEDAVSTYWIYDATGSDAGKKMFAAIVPASGDLPYLDIQRFSSDCGTWWNKDGGVSKSDGGSSNIVKSTGASGDNDVSWNSSALELYLYGDPNSWASSLGTFSDQGDGVWTATYNNYAPADAAGTSQGFKIKDSYNGWFATDNSQNVTLSDMIVGSTYNILASYSITAHTLTMSKTFVKGTVSFDLQGHGSAISALTNVAANAKITAPTTPTDASYVFGGWYKEAACTNAWDFANDVVTESMTLYAKWYQVTLVVKDDAGTTLSGGKPTLTRSGSSLTATTAGSYVFKDINITTGTGTLSSTSSTTPTITAVSSNITITAVFYKPLTVTKGTGTGTGTFTISAATVAHGGSVTVTCAAAAGYKNPWTLTVTPSDGATFTSSGSTTSITISNITKDITVALAYTDKGCTDHAGTNVTSGTSTEHTYGPVDPYYEYSSREILYTKTDLGLAAGKKGTIKSIYFEYAYTSAMTGTNSVKVYMANTSFTALSSSDYVTSFTEVYSGAMNFSINGWNEITLTTPFEYNGVGNLVVIIDDNSNKDEGTSPVFKYHTATTTTGAQIYTRSPSTNADPTTAATWTGATAINYRPNTKFCIQESDMTQYTVNWYVNNTETPVHTQTDYEGTALTDVPTPTSSDCDDEKVFVGWYTSTYSNASVAPAFVNPTTIPNGGANYYAVFATRSGTSKTYAFDITTSDFNGTSYAANNNEKTSTATATDASGATMEVKWTSNQVMLQSSAIQWQSSNGYIYNSTDLGTVNSVTVTSTAGTYTTYYGTSAQPSSGTQGSGKGFFKTSVGSSTGTASNIAINFTASNYTYSNYNTACTACAKNVTVNFTAAPTGGTVAVTKAGSAISSGSTHRTCEGDVALTVTVTPSTHYSVSGVTFTPDGTNLTTSDLSGTSTPTSTTDGVYTYNITIAQNATGTLTITPTLNEEAHLAITWMVNGSALTGIGTVEGLTFVYSGGDIESLPDEPSVPTGCSGTKVFAGWSTHNSGATEEEASYYDDLFTVAGPTGITSAQTYYAVFATSSSNALAGQTMWAEDFSGYSDTDVPSGSTAYDHTGTTVYNSGSVTYACTNGGSDTKVYGGSQTQYSGGAASPELLVGKTSGVFAVTGIPTGGQTELTLSYKSNNSNISVSSGTSGVTIGDPSVSSGTYTYTITISQSPAVANFALSFSNTASGNSRIDDISLVVPGSSSMSDYVTTCAPSYTITYNKNTEDAVTNLPSPTSVLQSTGSGTLSSTEPSRATYTFDGWAETTSGAVAYAAGASITGVTGDMTLYAVWSKTAVEEINLNYTTLNKYVGDAAVTLEVTSVSPTGADDGVTWSSSASGVASVTAAGVVSFVAVGTATITATSTVTNTTYAVCYVTVRTKPTATFVDNIHDGNGTDLDDYALQDVAGTAIVFPTLSNTTPGTDDCESQHYVFVGWTTSDNNTDPEDHLVTSDELEDDNNKTFYAVWADGVPGYTYTQLEDDAFSTSATYVIGGENNGERYYLYNNTNSGWGYTTNDPATNTPIYFTLSGSASALVVASTEATTRYLTPMSSNSFNMSTSSQTVQLNDDGTIRNPSNEDRELRVNLTNLRWYDISSFTGGSPAYFYNVTAGSTVSYRTSCCANNVAAPVVTATNAAYTATLTWSDVANATGYEVSWNGGAWTAATSPVNKTGLTASTTYTYKVRATYTSPQCGALIASGSITTDDVYTVTYAGGSGTGSCTATGSTSDASSPYEAGATVTLQTNGYTLSGHTFDAWVVKDAENNDVTVTSNQFTMPASNVTVTATWTAKVDKYYDRMHDGTSAANGGVADESGKYYITREGCQYTVPALTNDSEGETACHTTHYKLLGWIASSYLAADGSVSDANKSHIFTGGGTKTATGATYYAIWAVISE